MTDADGWATMPPMAGWRVRRGGVEEEGLTVYQVQERLRTGQLGPDEEAFLDGDWQRIQAVPALARYLPEAAPPPPKAGDVVSLHGVSLRLGPDGKPLPPDPATIARLLSTDAPGGQLPSTAKQVRVIMNVLAGVLVLVALLLLWKIAPVFWNTQ